MPSPSKSRRWLWIGVLLGAVLACVLLVHSCLNQLASDQGEIGRRAAKRDRQGSATTHPARNLPLSMGSFESNWGDSHTGEAWKVRKFVRLDAIPTVTSSGNRATASVAIEAVEGGEIWRKRTGLWDEMTPAEFTLWRGGAQDKHSAKALLIKEVNPQNSVSIIRQEITGDGEQVPSSRYNEGESGINITAEWKGDTLSIRWSGAGTEPQTELVTVPFSKQFKQDRAGESAAPSDGDKPQK